MKKPSALLFVAIVTLGMMLGFTTYTAKAISPGTVTINEPTGSEVVSFYEKITVNFDVDPNPGWIYHGSKISFGGVQIDYVTGGEGSSFEEDYFPETYAGVQTVTVTAYFVNYFLEEDTASDNSQFSIIICDNTEDLTHMRIDKLQASESGKSSLYGKGVTICIIDDILGCDIRQDEKFHKSLFRTCKNEIDGNSERKYVNISYLLDDDDDGDFYEEWEISNPTRQQKWKEIYEDGDGTYGGLGYVHGTYCLAVIRQIAPAADIVFIETLSGYTKKLSAVEWLVEDRDDPDYDYKAPYEYFEIDIISMSWSSGSSSIYADLDDEFETLADNGVIPVCSAGQNSEIFTKETDAYFPCSFEDVIGVTGVIDNNTELVTGDKWERYEDANSGWGIDTAAIYSGIIIDWEPVSGYSEFFGTSNACPMVAGIFALLKHYRNKYKSSETFDVPFIKDLLELTGDKPGHSPSYYENEMGGHLDWINEYQNETAPYYPSFPYHDNGPYTTYDCGWGIIDGYEMYKYFRQNY